jgi:hypothetical protein
VRVWFLVVRGGEEEGAYEAEKVQTPVGLLCVFETREDILVLVKLPLLNRDVDPDDVLPYNAPRADVQVAVYAVVRCNDGGRDGLGTDPTSEFPMSPSERPTASP